MVKIWDPAQPHVTPGTLSPAWEPNSHRIQNRPLANHEPTIRFDLSPSGPRFELDSIVKTSASRRTSYPRDPCSIRDAAARIRLIKASG